MQAAEEGIATPTTSSWHSLAETGGLNCADMVLFWGSVSCGCCWSFHVFFLKLKKLARSASLESSEETLLNNSSKDLQKLEGGMEKNDEVEVTVT